MANERVCLHCGCDFVRRGNGPRTPKYCSQKCYHTARPPSRFDRRAWTERNRERLREQDIAYRKANLEKCRAACRRWTAKNRDLMVQKMHLRRAGCDLSVKEIKAIKAAAAGRCTYCGKETEQLELDHVYPVVKGGRLNHGNALPCCRSCNSSKGARDPEDWIFEKFGIEGLARAIFMIENRKFEPKLYHSGVRIVEVRG